MADLSYMEGYVREVSEPNGNAKTWKVAVARDTDEETYAKKFIIWPTVYNSDEDNPDLDILRTALGDGARVNIGYTTKQKTYNGHTNPENTIYEVEVVGGGAAVTPSAEVPAPSSTGQASSLKAVAIGIIEDTVNHLNQIKDQFAKL